MRTVLISILSCFWYAGVACVCLPDQRSFEEKFAAYDFVAHVKIIKKEPLRSGDSTWLNEGRYYQYYNRVYVEIIQLFKGDSNTVVMEWGVNSSCDMGILINAEWVLFGSRLLENKVRVASCSPSFVTKPDDAHSDASVYRGFTRLNELRKFAGKPMRPITDGKIISHFSDGSISSIEEVHNQQLHGEQKSFYPDGSPLLSSVYINGVLEGKSRLYFNHGQLRSEIEYKNGKPVHSIFWYDTSFQSRKMESLLHPMESKHPVVFKIQKESESWTDTLTQNIHSVGYYRTGELKRQTRSFRGRNSSTSIEYYKSGNKKFELLHLIEADVTTEKRWDESGKLVSDKKWKKGKYLGDSVR